MAERLRKLPLGYFGKRDLADLTETLMGDVNRMEHVWSHVLGYLYGSYISTALIALCLLAYDWSWPLPACGASRVALLPPIRQSQNRGPGVPKRQRRLRSVYLTESKKHWKMSARFVLPIRRNGILKA